MEIMAFSDDKNINSARKPPKKFRRMRKSSERLTTSRFAFMQLLKQSTTD